MKGIPHEDGASRRRDALSAGAVAFQERRRVPRAMPAMECLACIPGSEAPFAIVEDVSVRGLRLRAISPPRDLDLRVGEELDLLIRWAGGAAGRRGKVVWVTSGSPGDSTVGLECAEPLEELEIPTLLDMRRVRIDPLWALRVPASLSIRRQVLPFSLVDGEVHVACADPGDTAALKAVERHVGRPLRALPAEPESLRRALQRVYGDASSSADPEDPSNLCHEFLHAAWLREASDIHIDPDREGVRVRLRVDGLLEEYRRLPARAHLELVSRIKVLAGMDIAEKRAPQDGSFAHDFGPGQALNIRVATLPTKYGERVTLRLLAIQMETLTLENLGMSARDLRIYEQSIQRPHGLLLATGPTGCGKTTTLYAALRRIIVHRSVNAITVQDPIEYDIPGVAQVEVDSAQKVTFAKALRSILRSDPDVLMIGEIRDHETVDIALKAALTGHLVLATLHTNTAVSAVTRLIDMGVERYLISATLRLVVAQRLVRRLCPRCRRPSVLSASQARSLGRPAEEGSPCFEIRGCIYCAGRGYIGRVGLFELVPLGEDWSRTIAGGIGEEGLAEMMRRQGMPTMLDDAIEKIEAGVTSLHEVLTAVST